MEFKIEEEISDEEGLVNAADNARKEAESFNSIPSDKWKLEKTVQNVDIFSFDDDVFINGVRSDRGRCFKVDIIVGRKADDFYEFLISKDGYSYLGNNLINYSFLKSTLALNSQIIEITFNRSW